MEHAHIIGLRRLAPGFPNPASQSLDPEKIFLQITLGQSKEKRTVATAKIDMERRGASENFVQVEAGEVRLQNQFNHGEKCRLCRDNSTCPPNGEAIRLRKATARSVSKNRVLQAPAGERRTCCCLSCLPKSHQPSHKSEGGPTQQ
jgi:hypothetical protein